MFDFVITTTASLVLSVITLIFAWFRTRKQDVEDRFNEGSKMMRAQDRRITALEQSIATLPQKDEIHRLELTLVEISGDMKAIRATMRGMSDSMARTESIVGRHEDHLIDKGKN